jgi:hypothetical protein
MGCWMVQGRDGEKGGKLHIKIHGGKDIPRGGRRAPLQRVALQPKSFHDDCPGT